MEIDINQKAISIGNKYDIYCNKQPLRFARSQLFQFLSQIELRDEKGQILLTINERFTILRTRYDIEYPNGVILEFRTISVWKGHYQCKFNQDVYDIYSHRGLKYSIYKNNSQIAWWNQDAVSVGKGDNFKMFANDDCDVDLLISFCLITDDSTGNDSSGSPFAINLGSIGPQAKKFNPNWHPNQGRMS